MPLVGKRFGSWGGLDVGEDRGKILVLTHALYSLKSSGASWHATLASTLENMGFQSTIADPDVWRRKAQKLTRFYRCLGYVLVVLNLRVPKNHHFVMMSSWEPQCHRDIIMRTPRITGKPKFSCSRGSLTKIPLL